MTHLYVVASTADGPCKIGITNNLRSRLSALQTGHPEPLIIWSGWKLTDGAERETESLVHAHFSEYRLKGEWFAITVKQAEEFIGRIDEDEDGFRWVATHHFSWPVRVFVNEAAI